MRCYLDEVASLLILNNEDNVVKLVGAFKDVQDDKWIITELATCNLAEYQIEATKRGLELREENLTHIFSECINIVNTMVKFNIYNFDIKRHNLLYFASSKKLRLCDFSKAKVFNNMSDENVCLMINGVAKSILMVVFHQTHSCKAKYEADENEQMLNCEKCCSYRYDPQVEPWMNSFHYEFRALVGKALQGKLALSLAQSEIKNFKQEKLSWFV